MKAPILALEQLISRLQGVHYEHALGALSVWLLLKEHGLSDFPGYPAMLGRN